MSPRHGIPRRHHWIWAAVVPLLLAAPATMRAAEGGGNPVGSAFGESGLQGEDRPLATPDYLRGGEGLGGSGVQIAIGPHAIALRFDRLGISDGQRPDSSEGVAISVDAARGSWKFGYSRQFYRRNLAPGTAFDGQPAGFLGVDGDHLWATLGWRPWHIVYLGAGLGIQHRLVQVKQDAAILFNDTDFVAMALLLAEVTLAPPFSLQFRLVRDNGQLLQMDSAMLQLVYSVPF